MRRFGFTLIELLVVIAIIAILAAIIFPVMARAKWSAYKSSDQSNMNALRTALQLYRTDQGAYPPVLLGYVTLYSGTPNIVPANLLHGPLYPKRIESLETMRPAFDRVGFSDITVAQWPAADPRATPSAPILDLDGSGAVDAGDDNPCARQAYAFTTVQRQDPNDPTGATWIDAEYYKISGYDVSAVPTGATGDRWELRYALHWTSWGIGRDPGCSPSGSGGNRFDDTRQLGYSDPPESTVITWNSYFRDYPDGPPTPKAGRQDIVLFLGGSAKPYDSRLLYDRSWRVLP